MSEDNRQAWDGVFKKRGHVFPEPHPDMPTWTAEIKAAGGSKVLDLGCGTGRHTVYFAQQGFDAYGLDISETGINMTRAWLDELGLTANLHQGDIYAPLPYADNFFDAVASIQVIHHARITEIRGAIAEVQRILKPSGKIMITVAKTRNQARSQNEAYKEIAPATFVPLAGEEKGLPHYFFTPETMQEAFSAFHDVTVGIDATDHYRLTARL